MVIDLTWPQSKQYTLQGEAAMLGNRNVSYPVWLALHCAAGPYLGVSANNNGLWHGLAEAGI